MSFNQVYGKKRDFKINRKPMMGSPKPEKVSERKEGRKDLAGKSNLFGNKKV